jgi:hypothetical protein
MVLPVSTKTFSKAAGDLPDPYLLVVDPIEKDDEWTVLWSIFVVVAKNGHTSPESLLTKAEEAFRGITDGPALGSDCMVGWKL